VAISHGRDLVETGIRRFYYELWNDWRLDLAEQLLSPELEFRGSLGKEVRGRDGFVAYAQIVRAAFPDFHNEVRELVIDGDRAAALLEYSGTHRGRIFAIAETGRTIRYRGAAFFRFDEHARIANAWILGDLVNLLKQLGVTRLP
jgi:steroid delta-isomerase-like uncharacterized protein